MSKNTIKKVFSPNVFSPQACPGGSKLSRRNEPRPQGSGPNKKNVRGLFITGTDTGVGKTVIAGAIAKILSQKNKIGVFKPVATGCKGLISEDAEFLKHCADSEFSLDIINPVRFEIPAAPLACEKVENKKVNLNKIASAYRKICEKTDFVIVEGIGGIKVPITKNIDVLTLAKMFNLPLVVVARSKLGTINHTLLTIDAIRNAGLSLAAVLINGYDDTTKDIAEKTNTEIIKKLGGIKIIANVPFDNSTNMKKFIIGKKILKALRKIDWQKMTKK